jgi:signal transduction histidine kinase
MHSTPDNQVSILLVDDDLKNLMVLETILDSPEYRLIKATTADQTLMTLMNEECAAIVMDVKMPDMSGIELAQLIKQRKKTQHIPILFLSAHYYEDEHIVLGYDAGAVDYITKPVNPAILRSKIGVFVDLFRKTTALVAANEELAVKNEELLKNADDRARRIHAEAARAEAEAANSAKDRFLAMLSHELRTPLSPVLHAVALIEEEGCAPATRELIETIRRNVQLEARLIDDLLDLARIRNGKLQLHFEEVEVHDLLRRAVEICDPEIRARQITLGTNFQAGSSRLQGDPARLQQIFWNLINNAIKYTPSGGSIDLSTEPGERDGTIRVAFADSGIGIAHDRLEKIFDAFEQVHGTQSQGLGLGLAICRALTEMHGGTIHANSGGENAGCLFTVQLPVATTANPTQKLKSNTPLPSTVPLRILLVEDHVDTATILKRLLSKRGHQVQSAVNVAEALGAMHAHEFDVLVSDIGLPDGRGLDLMPPFLACAGDRRVAGIALSGYGMPEDIERSREAGFHDHLTKPVDISRLQKSLTLMSEDLFSTPASNGQ